MTMTMINKPKNKQESGKLIQQLNLNRLIEKVFQKDDIPAINQFLDDTNLEHYGMRDSRPSGIFKYSVPKENVISELRDYTDQVKISETLYGTADMYHMLLQGHIKIDKSFNVMAECTDIKGNSLRYSMSQSKENIKYKWYFNLVEQKEPRQLANSKIIDLIMTRELFDVIVEFSYYDIKVGINNDNLIIWEIRNY